MRKRESRYRSSLCSPVDGQIRSDWMAEGAELHAEKRIPERRFVRSHSENNCTQCKNLQSGTSLSLQYGHVVRRMNREHRASSNRGKHEGESSFALCDRLGRTRDNSQRQLPTDHDMRPRPANIRLLNRRSTCPGCRSLCPRERAKATTKTHTDFAELTRSLHIRA